MCTYATLTDAGDSYNTVIKRYIFVKFSWCFCSTVLLVSLCDASKKQAKERVLDGEEAEKKIIFFKEATGV